MSSTLTKSPSRSLVSQGAGRDAVLLGVRLFLAVDLIRLCLRRWTTFNASVHTLDIYGFPAPAPWLVLALVVGIAGAVSFLSGWQVRWSAGLAGLVFMPVGTVFSATYVPLGWSEGMTSLLTMGAMGEDLVLTGGLLLLFLFGAGEYTVFRVLRWTCRRLGAQTRRLAPCYGGAEREAPQFQDRREEERRAPVPARGRPSVSSNSFSGSSQNTECGVKQNV